MSAPGDRDRHVVLHGVLAAILLLVVAAVFLFVVPDLFDRHDSSMDMLAIGAVIGTVAVTYLAARYLWRSFSSDGDVE
jgi:cytochrome b561